MQCVSHHVVCMEEAEGEEEGRVRAQRRADLVGAPESSRHEPVGVIFFWAEGGTTGTRVMDDGEVQLAGNLQFCAIHAWFQPVLFTNFAQYSRGRRAPIHMSLERQDWRPQWAGVVQLSRSLGAMLQC